MNDKQFFEPLATLDTQTSSGEPPPSPQTSSGEPKVIYYPLHRRVLVVALEWLDGTWCAYCVPVPGEDHDEECHLWRRHGCTLTVWVAHGLFPLLDRRKYRR